jgi:Zn ribbon nucleic-acid-binding protein
MTWENKMQASFQMLALKNLIGEVPQGILVSVLEKPRVYIPKRTCKGCKEAFEMALWLETGTGEHACPQCGHTQVLKPYEPTTTSSPQFYRIVVVRSPERLETAMDEIGLIALKMEEMRSSPPSQFIPADPPNREACVHPIYRACEYFKIHTYDQEPEEDENLEQFDAKRYLNRDEELAPGE